MTITSTSFQKKEPIPDEHSYKGENINPPLTFSQVPREAKSLFLIVEDPDAPGGIFTHWILYKISPATLQIPQAGLPRGAKVATNDYGEQKYNGPAPPSGTHRYYFKLYALDIRLNDMRPTDTREKFISAIEGHIIDEASLMGKFSA